jgi:hypothetical protein
LIQTAPERTRGQSAAGNRTLAAASAAMHATGGHSVRSRRRWAAGRKPLWDTLVALGHPSEKRTGRTTRRSPGCGPGSSRARSGDGEHASWRQRAGGERRHEPRIDISGWPLVTYVTDVETAMTGANKAPAKRRSRSTAPRSRSSRWRPASSMSSSSTSSRCCPDRDAGSFDGLDPEHIELERVRVLEGEHGVTHLRYRVRRPRGA